MIPIVAFILGFVFGWVRAARRGGGTADRARYGVAHGLIFALVALALGALAFQLGLLSPGA